MSAARRPQLFLVDVFAESPYAGNQLAVVVGDTGWSTAQLQTFAREMNFSETTFVASGEPRRDADGDAFDVRIFTPGEELPFAGHPTLGSAWVLRRFFAPSADEVALRLGIGVVPVRFEDRGGHGEVVWMSPPSPTFGARRDAAEIAALLGVDVAAIDERFPCQQVSIGISFVLVPLRSLEALRALRPSVLPVGPDGRTLFLFAFCGETYEPGADLAARMFFEAAGIREDPATGSANACLAAWLSEHRYFGGAAVNVRVQQGYEISRPSCLYLRARREGPDISVNVGGKVVLVASGEIA